MLTIVRTVFVMLGIAGFILLLGTAGADCDGKCMENSLPLDQMLLQVFIGFVMMGVAFVGYRATE